VEAGVAF